MYRELNIYVDATNVDKRHMVAAELALDGLYRAIAVVPVAELAPMVSHVLRYRAHGTLFETKARPLIVFSNNF